MRFVIALALFPLSLAAHEVWLDAEPYQAPIGQTIEIHLRNGENFDGIGLVYNQAQFARFDRLNGAQTVPVEGRAGDRPALSETPADGLNVYVYESTLSSLTYREWNKFMRFAEHKDFPDIAARHDARNLPREGFREAYSRHIKALIGVGSDTGSDRAFGLATEFVALANPYTDDLTDGLPVRLFYQGEPRADAQVELFEKAPGGEVTITLHRTDADGAVRLPVKSGHTYLADAVVLREPSDAAAEKGAVWETLWAALTFAVP